MHKIFSVELSPFRPTAVIATTAYANPGGYPRAESFVLIPGENGASLFKRMSFDTRSFGGSPIELNEDFMSQEALEQAKIDLGQYLAEQPQAGFPTVTPGPVIRETDTKLIVQTWIRGLGEGFRQIARETEYQPLRDLLLSVFALPQIERREL